MLRRWAMWYLAFFLIGAGWALFTPIDGFPDEAHHTFRAVSVDMGEILPHIGAYDHGTGAITNIPLSLWHDLSRPPCLGIHTATFCATAGAPRGEVTVVTGEGRMFPLFYAIVGLPSLVTTHRVGWYLMRLLTAVLCAGILASGFLVLTTMSRRPIVLVGAVLVGLTPLVLDLTGAINPSGLEAASALCFIAVLLALLHEERAIRREVLVGFGAASGLLLATSRQLGPIWVVIAVGLAVATAKRTQWRRFIRLWETRVILGVSVLALALVEAWALVYHSDQVFVYGYKPKSVSGALVASLHLQPLMLRQEVAYLGYVSKPPSDLALACWIGAVVGLITLGVMTGRRAGLLTFGSLALVGFVPFAVWAYAYYHPQIGGWQGRYTLPLVVAAPLIGVVGPRLDHREHRLASSVASVVVLLALVGNVAVAWGVWPTHRWYAILGATLLGLGATAFLANLGWADLAWQRANRRNFHRGTPAEGEVPLTAVPTP